jgi:hypothetical protein
MRILATTISLAAAALVLLSTSGCATGPEATERDFGNSVRNMVQAQTLDPTTAAVPDPNGPDSGDGQRLDNVLEAYRADVAKPEEVAQPLVISVGN